MTHKQRILIVDDEKFNRQVLCDTLLPDYEVFLAKNGEQALASANATPPPDLILLDVMMPGMDGYEVIRQLRCNERTSNIPVLFITGKTEEADETKGLELGAVDYIFKPFRSAVVLARVQNHMIYIQQRKQLELDAFIDSLTGIPNRRQFDKTFEQEWSRANRHGTVLSLIMVDVDCFKLYNDTYGHGEGDKVLQQIAEVMSHEINRAGELVARYGGEEFMILLPEVSFKAGVPLAERIGRAVENLMIAHEKSTASAFVTISMGGITLTPPILTGITEALALVDNQLYLAKKAGRNQLIWYIK